MKKKQGRRRNGEDFEIPDPFNPVRIKRTLVVQKETVTLELIQLIPNVLYSTRFPLEQGKLKLRGGEILSRNDELAKRNGADPSNPDQQHFMCFDTIHKAVRGLSLVDQRYRSRRYTVLA